MAYKTPRARVMGLGSAHGGTHHWLQMRLSSIAMVPLTLFFVFPFAQALGGSREGVIETYSNPWNAIVAVLFIAVMFHHLMQGVQCVIEDYVHNTLVKAAALVANMLFCAFFGLAGIFAVLKIAFAA